MPFDPFGLNMDGGEAPLSFSAEYRFYAGYPMQAIPYHCPPRNPEDQDFPFVNLEADDGLSLAEGGAAATWETCLNLGVYF